MFLSYGTCQDITVKRRKPFVIDLSSFEVNFNLFLTRIITYILFYHYSQSVIDQEVFSEPCRGHCKKIYRGFLVMKLVALYSIKKIDIAAFDNGWNITSPN